MSDLAARPAPLRDAGESCDGVVAVQVDVAKRMFSGAVGALSAARMGGMVSAESARTCLDGLQDTLGDASRAMHVLGARLRNTAAVVNNTDQDAAELYRGPVPEIPPIEINVGG